MRLTINLSKVELKKSKEDVTGKMGLSWLMHSTSHFGLEGMISDEYGYKKKSNREIEASKKIMAGVMMMASGGTRIEDIEVLRADEGLKNSLGWDSIIGSDTLINFIGDKRSNAKNRRVNNAMVIKAMKQAKEEEFTYDNDATYIDSEKKSARYSYLGEKQFSGLMGCIAELELINTVEYRRGNISPQTGILNQLRKAVAQAKRAGKRIKRFRNDSAAHQNKIMTYCDMEDIEYYISIDKNEAVMRKIKRLKSYEWKTMYGRYKEQYDKKWAETTYVVSKGFKIRILILRWKNPNPDLFDASPYCYHVITTNNKELEPMQWLEMHNGRMGTIEQLNKEIKIGMGCNYTPSHEFEKNRGYFLLGVLAHNMVQIMKLFYLDESTRNWTIKTMRYQFINVCGKIVKTGRRFYCKIINVTNEIFELFRYCKARLCLASY
jgi:hypothetical protein